MSYEQDLGGNMFSAWMLTAALAGEPVDLGPALAMALPWRGSRWVEGLPDIPASAWAQAAAGEVASGVVGVEGEAARKTWAVGVLAQPITRVWGAISDESLHPEYTSLSHTEIVAGQACASGRHVLQVLPVGVPGIDDRWWVSIRTNNTDLATRTGGSVRELVWENARDGVGVTSEKGKALIADGTMVGFTRGAWLLIAVDGNHTLVEYYAWVHPGGSLPAGLAASFAGRTLRSTFAQMESLAADPRLRCTGT